MNVEEDLKRLFEEQPKHRNITLYTGVGGYDLFNIAMEESMGFKRIIIGDKVPRILRLLKHFPIKKSLVGYHYKLTRI